eukprot:4908903-Prymnesium_polylepis.1
MAGPAARTDPLHPGRGRLELVGGGPVAGGGAPTSPERQSYALQRAGGAEGFANCDLDVAIDLLL